MDNADHQSSDPPIGRSYAESAPHPLPPTQLEAEKPRWSPSNLTKRIFTAIMLIPPVLWVCYTGGLPYLAVVIAFSVLGINEFYGFISAKGATPHRLPGLISAAALPVIVYFGNEFMAISFMTAIFLTVMIMQLTKAEVHEAIASVSATFFGVFYVGWLLSYAVSVRFIADDLSLRSGLEFDPRIGFFFMVFCLTAAVGSDTAAYFVGRKFGRHKLAPEISPNKTIEGAIGGILLGGVAAGLACKFIFDTFIDEALAADFSYIAAGLFGVAIAAVSIIGDLVESVLKRDADLKDAGGLLPGVGGVLDRIDSALVAIPVMYYLLLGYYYSLYPAL
ncbi:MAG: phosphatidate cytidylyltransferase [bacterium]|nr:phosphatidate cytidylyltransferase [bacterium]